MRTEHDDGGPAAPYQDSVSFSFRAFAKLILLMPAYLLWLLGAKAYRRFRRR